MNQCYIGSQDAGKRQRNGKENEVYSLEKAAFIDDFCPSTGNFSRVGDNFACFYSKASCT
jgi:hypothetical protein